MEYKLYESFESENAVVRIFIPELQSKEEKQSVIDDIAKASYDMALDLLKKNRVATT